jgi:hypothetical protein
MPESHLIGVYEDQVPTTYMKVLDVKEDPVMLFTKHSLFIVKIFGII